MTPTTKPLTIRGVLNGRWQTGLAIVLLASAGLLAIATGAAVAGLLGNASMDLRPASVSDSPIYSDHAIRHAVPAAVAPARDSYPDLGLRNAQTDPAAASYPDLALRQAPALPAAEGYPDFGQRHQPAGTDR